MNRESERKRLVELLREVDNMRLLRCCFGECADHLLDNGVVVPPCKVGDKVYILEGGKVINYFVLEISKHYNGTMYFEVVPQDTRGCPQWFHVMNRFADENIGKTVFTSREEAVKALEGSGKK